MRRPQAVIGKRPPSVSSRMRITRSIALFSRHHIRCQVQSPSDNRYTHVALHGHLPSSGLGTFAGECRELDASDLPWGRHQNVDSVEFTTAPIPVRTQPPTSAVRSGASLGKPVAPSPRSENSRRWAASTGMFFPMSGRSLRWRRAASWPRRTLRSMSTREWSSRSNRRLWP